MECSYRKENITALSYAFLSFMLPFVFSHPQWLVGTAVNLMLALAAYSLPWKRILPMIFLPSLGALASGIVFGPMSYLLLYMIPFVWAGNALFVFMLKRNHRLLAPVGKAAFIFFAALLMFLLKVIPAPFLIAMGPVQLLTASAGLISACFIRRTYLQGI